MGEAATKYNWESRSAVLHRVKLSALYHRARERTFALADRWSKFAALASGSAALAAAIGDGPQTWLLAIVALSSALNLAFAFADRARQHADLAAKWTALEADIVRAGVYDFTAADVALWDSRRAEIEAIEPPHSEWLALEIQNRIVVAEGGKVDPMKPWQWALARLGI